MAWWTTEDELPQNSVISITQTRDGYLWLGTGSGLTRFDGTRFRTFDDPSLPGLAASKIVKLFEDSRRNLWFGTDAGNVFRIDPDGKVLSLPLGLPANPGPLVAICEDSSGAVWFNMAKGQLFRFSGGAPKLLLDKCRGLIADHSGLVWIYTADGRLLGLGPVASSAVTAIPVSYELPVGRLDFLLASKAGGFWRLANGRIQKCKGDRVERDFGLYPWRFGTPILAACEDQQGNLIVGTYGDGVYWLDAAGKATHVSGLSHGYIWCLCMDREGDLWVGTDGGGLNRVKRQIFDVAEVTQGVIVQSVCEDLKGGLWVGYNYERIDHWNGRQVQQFTNLWPFQPAGLPRAENYYPYVQSVFEDRDGQVWAGVGLAGPGPEGRLLKLQNGRFLPVPAGTGAGHQVVSAIYQDRQGRLWVGTKAGLARFDQQSWKTFGVRDGLSSEDVTALAEDVAGNLWVGTERGGLNRLHDNQFTCFRRRDQDCLPSDEISSLLADRDGVLWVGTSAGLARFADGKWTRYTRREGLASNRIGYLLEDGVGNLWLGSNAGLMRIPKKDLNEFARGDLASSPCRLFGKPDGLPTGECTQGGQPAACRDRDGILWFPTIKGLVSLDPRSLVRNTNPPPVVIETVLVDNVPQTSEALRAPAPTAVTLPPGKESLDIAFAALNLSAPDKGFFRYRLEPEGHETRWRTVPAKTRVAPYNNLSPGRYRFQVTACNEDGEWNPAFAELAVTVLPPFWQKGWFIALVTLSLLGMLVGSVHYVSTQKLQRQLAVMRQHEALEKERARIARDLHDQLGANLTQVALLAEMAEADKDRPAEVEAHARQVSQTARDTTRALDEIVWTVNPSNDTLEGLINYTCKYAQEYLALAGLRYRLEVPPGLPQQPISPELRHNVFLVAKEAINNIVKHAKASAAWLRLHLEAEQFVLEIEDNGRGIAAGDENKGRSGLRNMRKRMADVGGSFTVQPGNQGGTLLRLTAPLNVDPRPPSG